jgi:hypothetical protein
MPKLLPDSTHIRVYPQAGYGFVVCGYCQNSVAVANAMFRYAKKQFPKLTQRGCVMGRVTKSSQINGCTVLRFTYSGGIEKTEAFTTFSFQGRVDFAWE